MKETLLRILSALISLPILYFTISNHSHNSLFFALLISISGMVALIELSNMFKKEGYGVRLPLLMVFNLVIFYIFYKNLDTRFIFGLFILLLLLSVVIQLFDPEFKKVLVNISLIFFAVIYTGIMWACLIPIKQLGVHHIIILIVATWFCDIGAYFIGITLGKHKLKIKTSPKKSIEGFIGGILVSITATFIATKILKQPFYWWYFMLPLVTIIGDLLESILKRACKVKDSSNIIPGHGGLLDVIDAMIFTAPVYYFSLVLLT